MDCCTHHVDVAEKSFWGVNIWKHLAKASNIFHHPAVRRVMECITGAVLVGLGIRLAIEQR